MIASNVIYLVAGVMIGLIISAIIILLSAIAMTMLRDEKKIKKRERKKKTESIKPIINDDNAYMKNAEWIDRR